MNKIKLWYSKSRLLKKLKAEKAKYGLKRRKFWNENPGNDGDELLHYIKNEGYAQQYHKPARRVTPWDATISLMDEKIKKVSNSGSYYFAKKIAKRRKAGR